MTESLTTEAAFRAHTRVDLTNANAQGANANVEQTSQVDKKRGVNTEEELHFWSHEDHNNKKSPFKSEFVRRQVSPNIPKAFHMGGQTSSVQWPQLNPPMFDHLVMRRQKQQLCN